MKDLGELALHLSDPDRIGLTPELCEQLGLVDEHATRGRLLARTESDNDYLLVEFLACYVIDDTDFWSDGEIYWWSIPTLLHQDGSVSTDPLTCLPNAMPPHKCGDNEWMTNLSLEHRPLWAAIPPDPAVMGCTIRLGVYDDDGAVADMPASMAAGLEALAALGAERRTSPEQVIEPVRQAIWERLKGKQDDLLIEQDISLRRGEVVRFSRGLIGSAVNAMARVFYFVRDLGETEQFGPVSMHRGQSETVRFEQPMERGGRLALFARGADVFCPTFGDLSCEMPFRNEVIRNRHVEELQSGSSVTAEGPAKLIAFYTPH